MMARVKPVPAFVASLAMSMLFAPSARAQCFGEPKAMPKPQAWSDATRFAVKPLLAAYLPPDETTQKTATIVGLWKVTFLGGAGISYGIEAFQSDGTEELNDTASHGATCLGVWAQTGPHTYRLNHPAWLFDGTTLVGTIAIRYNDVVVSRNGLSFAGTFTVDFFDLSGAVHLFHDEGTLTGERITAD